MVLDFCGFRMLEIHLHQESSNVGLEDGMNGGLFAREYLVHCADSEGTQHIQIAVVNRTPGHRAGLVVIRDKSEVQRLAPAAFR